MVTFDGQRFVFDGNCEYILATVSAGLGPRGPRGGHGGPGGPQGRLLLSAVSPQDSCSASDSQPTFKILTENVVCGKSGVTCSRAIKIFLGVSRRVAFPTSPWGPRAWPLGALTALCPGLHVRIAAAVSPELDNRAAGRGSPTSLTLSPRHSFQHVLESSADSRL